MIVRSEPRWWKMMLAYRWTAFETCGSRILLATMVGALVTFLEQRFGVGSLDVTPIPFSLTGVAIGIFLGFRGKTAYDRYWEGRSLWGGIVNHTRNLARQALTLTSAPEDQQEQLAAWRRQLVFSLIAFAHALRHHLRGSQPWSDLEGLLQQEELEALRSQRNVPLAILVGAGGRVSWARARGWLPEFQVSALDGTLSELTNMQGGCEKIRNTPVPYAYGIMSHRIVSFYCLCLPLGIVDDVKIYTPFVTMLVSYAFWGLDNLGTEIEEPFGTDPHDLPLSSICRTIEVNLKQMAGETQVPEFLTPVDNILL